jgi:hypothetical protein
MDEELVFSNSVGGTAVDWALGATIAFAAQSAEEDGGSVGGSGWGAEPVAPGEPNGVWWAVVGLAAGGLALSAAVGPAGSTARWWGGGLLALRVRHTLAGRGCTLTYKHHHRDLTHADLLNPLG